MATSFVKAFELIFSGDKNLYEIIFTTLYMAFTSSLLSLLIGGPIGVMISTNNFRGKSTVRLVVRTLMGLPPVAVGIIIYVLFSGTGPFGSLKLIYSVELMIIAQIVLITPIVAGMTDTSLEKISPPIAATAKGLNFNFLKTQALVINESKFQILAVYLYAFARAIAEVGAVQIVGGNILHKTRVMTTTIALNYNTGQFTYAIGLGIILLIISLLLNLVAASLQLKKKRRVNVKNK